MYLEKLHPRNLMCYLTLAVTISTLVTSIIPVDKAFIIDHELGMFACKSAINSNEALTLFNISSLCDSKVDCSNALDEERDKLECRDDCDPPCMNGACLKGSQCFCDCDWGGKSCDIEDMNECKNGPCHNLAFCTNTLGSYYCTCLPGFTGNGSVCDDMDECLNNEDVCGKDSTCYNVPGSFYCECKKGFSGTGFRDCVDIDECLMDDRCKGESICKNTAGSFECNCEEGFTYENNNCIRRTHLYNAYDAINECEENQVCDPQTNTCNCKDGFQLDQGLNCVDINECEINADICYQGLKCINVIGGYMCENSSVETFRVEKLKGESYLQSQKHASKSQILPISHYSNEDVIKLSCEPNGMLIYLNFEAVNLSYPFNGVVYVKGNYDLKRCKKNFYNNKQYNLRTQFYVNYESCFFEYNNDDTEISSLIFIQTHPKLLTSDASVYKVVCEYPKKVITLTQNINVSSSSTDEVISSTSDLPNIKMKVINTDGKSIQHAVIGSPLRLQIYLENQGLLNYDLMARNCVARTIDEKWEYKLINENGCSEDKSIIQNFVKTSNYTISSLFYAFKFPNAAYMRFQCDIKLCLNECEKIFCSDNHEYYSKKKRKRRSEANFTKEVDVVFKANESVQSNKSIDQIIETTLLEVRDLNEISEDTFSNIPLKEDPSKKCLSMTQIVTGLSVSSAIILIGLIILVISIKEIKEKNK